MRKLCLSLLVMMVAACSPPEPSDTPLELPGTESALAPRISHLPDGRLLLSWIEPAASADESDALRYAMHDGDTWTVPATAISGDEWFNNWADTAGVTALENGLLVAHWLRKNGEATYAYEVRYSVSADMGRSWSEPHRAHEDDSPSEHGFVSVLPRDDGFELFWLDGRNTLVEDGGMTLRMGRFAADGERLMSREVDDLTCDCCPTAAIRNGEESLLVYRDRDSAERRDIFMARISANADISLHEVHDDAWVMPACPVNGPAIAMLGENVHVLWFTAADGEREIRHASGKADGSFGEATVLASGDAHGRVGLLEMPDKGLLGMWLAGRGDAGRIELALLGEDGGIARRHAITGLSVARAAGYPQVGQLPGGDILVVWTESGDEGGGLAGRRARF